MEVLLGALMGFLIGGAFCVRYLRHEIAANMGQRRWSIEPRLELLSAELNLATGARLAPLNRGALHA
jgi:hypothetical protein